MLRWTLPSKEPRFTVTWVFVYEFSNIPITDTILFHKEEGLSKPELLHEIMFWVYGKGIFILLLSLFYNLPV